MGTIELTDLELVNLPIFEDIDPSKIRAMISCLGGYVRYYKKNEYVLMDEEMTMNVCVLITGTVHMLKEDEDGHLSLITYMQPGELFGESFALRKLPRSRVSFMAARNIKVLCLPLSKVMTMCSHKCRFHSTMISNMYELISRKNLALMQKIDILSKDTLRDKIIFYLRLQLSGNPEYGASNNMKIKGRTIHVPLNKSEFAHYLNVNRTSLCRELSSMEKDGLITVDGDNYTLIPRKDEHEVPPQDLP